MNDSRSLYSKYFYQLTNYLLLYFDDLVSVLVNKIGIQENYTPIMILFELVMFFFVFPIGLLPSMFARGFSDESTRDMWNNIMFFFLGCNLNVLFCWSVLILLERKFLVVRRTGQGVALDALVVKFVLSSLLLVLVAILVPICFAAPGLELKLMLFVGFIVNLAIMSFASFYWRSIQDSFKGLVTILVE